MLKADWGTESRMVEGEDGSSTGPEGRTQTYKCPMLCPPSSSRVWFLSVCPAPGIPPPLQLPFLSSQVPPSLVLNRVLLSPYCGGSGSDDGPGSRPSFRDLPPAEPCSQPGSLIVGQPSSYKGGGVQRLRRHLVLDAQALEVARDSPEGADDPTVSAILEAALTAIWRRIRASPAYVMTREEFAVFNYFQHRFQGDRLAVAARKRGIICACSAASRGGRLISAVSQRIYTPSSSDHQFSPRR